MTDTDDFELTPEDMIIGAGVVSSIDALTDLAVQMAMTICKDDVIDTPATALVIAEGVLSRIICAYTKAHADHSREHLDHVLEVSATHVRDLTRHFWEKLAAPDA